MGRVISNTFSLTSVSDAQAARPNLVHCSQFNADRLGWWTKPSSSNTYSYGVNSGQYGIDGFNAYEVQAKPGMVADLTQYIAKDYKGSLSDHNAATSNYGLDAGKWYTLSFRVRGIAKKQNTDGSYSDNGSTRLYLYLVGNTGTSGVQIVDTTSKYYVDGEEKTPSGDMCTAIVINWTISTHTITFKTASSLTAVPKLYFRSFGEGHTTYPTYFAGGSCLFRIACVKIEEGKEATAYTPHATEMQPPVHAVAFKRTDTDISSTTPTGGSYSSPTPTGWSDGIPSGSERLWETKAVFYPELTSATWSNPSPVGDTVDTDVEFCPYAEGTPSKPKDTVGKDQWNLAEANAEATATTQLWFDPVRNSSADFTKMIWKAERTKKSGSWGDWTIYKIKGEDGDNGKDAVVLDLDNETDSIAVDSSGYVTASQTVTTKATIYKGSSPVTTAPTSYSATAINGVSATVSQSGGVVTVSYTFGTSTAQFAASRYSSTITVVSGGVTYKATFSLTPVRAGAKGNDAVIYQLVPSHSAFSFQRNSNDTLTGSYTLTCKVRQTVGGLSSVGSVPTGYTIKYGVNDADPCTNNLNNSLAISASVHSGYKNIVLELYNGSTLLDRETIPILKDGYNGAKGENGADGITAWLDCPYSAIPCDSDGKSKITSFTVNAYMREGDGNAEGVSSSYTIKSVITYTKSDGTATTSTSSSTTGSLTVSVGTTYELASIALTLTYAGNSLQTINLLPVLDGALGEQGYNYVPQILGVWDSTTQYTWDSTVRQGCLYLEGGVYYLYVVKERFKNLPVGTIPTETEFWEKAGQYKTIFAEAVYTPNANIGGFYLTNNMFMSSERAGQFVYVPKDYRYQGLWDNTYAYNTNRIVYYNGYYYVSIAQVSAGVLLTNTSYWNQIVSGSSTLTANQVEYLLKAVVGKPKKVTFPESDNLGIWISGVCDTSSGYRTVKKNKLADGWLVHYTNGTSAYDPTSEKTPTTPNPGWRYLTDVEYALLGITAATSEMEYEFKKVDIPRYVINGVTGTPSTFMPDGSVWTYDASGKQTIGKPEKQRIELTPDDGGLSLFDTVGSRVVTVDSTKLTSTNLYGTNSGTFTLSTASYSSSSINYAEVKTTHKLSNSVTLSGRVEITYSGVMTAFAGLPNVSVTPRSYCNLSLSLCTVSTDSEGVTVVNVVREIASLYSGGIAKQQNIIGSISFDADGSSAYALYAIATYRQYYSGSTLRYSITLSESKYSNQASVTRVHANGFALGNSSTNYFAAYNYDGVKMTAVNSGAKLDFSSSGLSYTKGSYGGLLPITIWMGYAEQTADTVGTITRKYGTINISISWTSKGNCTLTLPSNFTKDNTFPTITTYQTLSNGSNGVSAMIKEWSGTTMDIELNNDGSTADISGFFLKLDYFG